jgi:ABC-type dipeptide/oligopeptide/nickel transport system ATPase subunit
MLEGKDIFFRHIAKGPWVLNNLNIKVQPREIVGLLGPSGYGKSTLAQVLAGYLIPQSGNITADQKTFPFKGYCPVQLLFQHPELTVNPRWKVKRIISEAYAPSQKLLHNLEISSQWMDRFPHELSGGEIQRLAVARALSPATRYLIADEMTTMLDAQTQAHIWHVVLNHCRSHKIGLLAISHNRPLLDRICDYIIELSEIQKIRKTTLLK